MSCHTLARHLVITYKLTWVSQHVGCFKLLTKTRLSSLHKGIAAESQQRYCSTSACCRNVSKQVNDLLQHEELLPPIQPSPAC